MRPKKNWIPISWLHQKPVDRAHTFFFKRKSLILLKTFVYSENYQVIKYGNVQTDHTIFLCVFFFQFFYNKHVSARKKILWRVSLYCLKFQLVCS